MARKAVLVPGGPRPTVPSERTLSPKWGQSVPAAKAAKGARAPQGPPSTGPLQAQNPGLASERLRARMLERLRASGIRHEAVLAAMSRVPRHLFVDGALASRAYEDTALPIGHAQTISQPYVVARSLALALDFVAAEDPQRVRALEIGTGCGYQAAVMSHLFAEVVSIERIEPLHRSARERLESMGLSVRLQLADGQAGLSDDPGFDVIVMAAGMPHPPPELLRQLTQGGVLVGPIGAPEQRLVVIQRVEAQRYVTQTYDVVQFVPIRSGIQQ